jgi:hypothetical protein
MLLEMLKVAVELLPADGAAAVEALADGDSGMMVGLCG